MHGVSWNMGMLEYWTFFSKTHDSIIPGLPVNRQILKKQLRRSQSLRLSWTGMMTKYTERHYRKRTRARGLRSFQVGVKETDLWVSAEQELKRETRDLIIRYRHQLEGYIESHPLFLTALQPMPEDPYAPPMVSEMI